MLFLKIISTILLAANVVIGFRFFLNVINVLKTSKYSPGATALYAFIFLGLAIAGVYFLFFSSNSAVGLWLSIAPWVLMLVVLLITMLTSDYK